MTEQVMELARELCGTGQEELLRLVCVNACQVLEGRLRDGLTPGDCGEAFPLAAAWLAADWMRGAQGLSGVTSLSAGDLTVRREGGGEGGQLSQRIEELLAPYLADQGFVFRGVGS